MTDLDSLRRLEDAVSAFRKAENWRMRLERGFALEALVVRVGGVREEVALSDVLTEKVIAALLGSATEMSQTRRTEMDDLIKEVQGQ